MLAGAAYRLLEQIQMLSPVNRVAMRDRRSRIVPRMRGRRPSREYQDDHRQRKNHREPKCETVWFLCHVCLWPPECRCRRPTLRTEISRDACTASHSREIDAAPCSPILSPDRCPLGTRLAPSFLVKRLGPSFPPPALCERGGTTFALRSSGARDDPLLSR